MLRDPGLDQTHGPGARIVTNRSFADMSRHVKMSCGVTLAKLLNVTVDDSMVGKNRLIVTLIISCLLNIGGGTS